MKFYLTVSLDTECDKGPNWKVRQPLSFKNILKGVPQRLQPLFEEYDIKPTYLLSPEVLKNNACVRLFQSLADRVELGTHLHAEFIEPYPEWQTNKTVAFQSDFNPKIEFEKLANLTKLFKERIGYSPTSFRAGRFGISKHTLIFLEKLEYLVDSSVTPNMWWWRRKGEGVNFLGAPNQPYHPARYNFRKPGNMRILEVPITLHNPFWDKFPRAVLQAINPINKIHIVVLNTFFKKRLHCSWLRPTYSSAEEMLAITEHLSSNVGSDRAVLCMMFHSNEAWAGMCPYNPTKDDVGHFIERLKVYFKILFSKFKVQSIGLSETAEFV